MNHMVCFCNSSVYRILTGSKAVEPRLLTSGKHALHEVVDIAENNSETLWSSLLPNQGLDLNTLQYRLRYGGIGILAGVEYRTEGDISSWRIRNAAMSLTQESLCRYERLRWPP